MNEEMEKKLKEIADKTAKEYQPEKIILFGSYAWGTPTEDSDLDLFIVKETEDIRQTTREINSSIFPRLFPIDLLVYTPEKVKKSINEYKNLFIEDILRHGKVLYTKPGSMFSVLLPERPLAILH